MYSCGTAAAPIPGCARFTMKKRRPLSYIPKRSRFTALAAARADLERRTTLHVYPNTQSYYCFGCGAGGDVITFIKKINNVDYIEAVKFLAGRAGMALPEEDDQTGRLRSRIISINKDAARFYFSRLNSDAGRVGRAYWRGRGLSDATIKRFGLGYAPDSFGALRDHMRGKGYKDEELTAAWLAARRRTSFWQRASSNAVKRAALSIFSATAL